MTQLGGLNMEYLSQIQEFISTAEPEILLLILVGVLFVFLLLAKVWQKLMRFITTVLIIACVVVAVYLILVEGVLW